MNYSVSVTKTQTVQRIDPLSGAIHRLWKIDDILALIEGKEAKKPAKRGFYKKKRDQISNRDATMPSSGFTGYSSQSEQRSSGWSQFAAS